MTLAEACFRYDAEIGRHRASKDDMATSYDHCCRLIGGERKLINVTAGDIAQAVRQRACETVGKKEPRPVAAARDAFKKVFWQWHAWALKQQGLATWYGADE